MDKYKDGYEIVETRLQDLELNYTGDIRQLVINYVAKKYRLLSCQGYEPDKLIYLLDKEISDEFKVLVISQIASHKYKFHKVPGCDDLAIIIADQQKIIEKHWNDLNYRLAVIPGKEAITSINRILQERYGVSITHNMIISHMTQNDIDKDLLTLFERIRKFV